MVKKAERPKADAVPPQLREAAPTGQIIQQNVTVNNNRGGKAYYAKNNPPSRGFKLHRALLLLVVFVFLPLIIVVYCLSELLISDGLN